LSEVFYGRWNPPGATTLPELEGCFNDMWAARDFCDRLAAVANSSAHDYVLMDALETAALVRYCRCFTSGKRLRLNLNGGPPLTAQEVQFHERVCVVRDKHVAHPVNLLETQSVYLGIQVAPQGQPRATVVSSGTRTGLSLSASDASALAALCARWLAWLRDAMNAECSRLLPLAQALSAEQLLALPQGPVEPHPNPLKVRPNGPSAV
jgi:tRNA threonylcarbamoyladenosine modification (KEOPS) complex  Pcc1 subunit